MGVGSFRPRTAIGGAPKASGAASTRLRSTVRGLLAPLVLVSFLLAPAGSASASITFDLQWGSLGTGNGSFTLPTRAATDSSGNAYVSDRGNHRIQKFDSSGTFITKWGATLLGLPVAGTGDGEFNLPAGVATDSLSNVYVADTTNNRIQKFNSTGGFLTKWGTSGSGNGQFALPQGIATDSSDNVYVADTGNNRIQKFNSTGGFITAWGSAGTGDGQFTSPSGVAVDSSGNVYVADAGNNRIQKFDSSGTFITKWGSVGTGNGQFGALPLLMWPRAPTATSSWPTPDQQPDPEVPALGHLHHDMGKPGRRDQPVQWPLRGRRRVNRPRVRRRPGQQPDPEVPRDGHNHARHHDRLRPLGVDQRRKSELHLLVHGIAAADSRLRVQPGRRGVGELRLPQGLLEPLRGLPYLPGEGGGRRRKPGSEPRLPELHGRHHPPRHHDRLRPLGSHQRRDPDLRLLLRAGGELSVPLRLGPIRGMLGPR